LRARSSRYVLKLDIRKFFPTIDHEVLKERIRRAVKDAGVLWLCDLIIDNSNEQERVVCYRSRRTA
jgi:retron-type reverse transcriptase